MASYSIPIQVPPGTNGVHPNLSLTYNSQQGNGLIGMSWNLEGISAIYRCAQTIAQDEENYVPGVNFSSHDRFCMDGQRLILSSGTYGADQSVYHAEIETWT